MESIDTKGVLFTLLIPLSEQVTNSRGVSFLP
jgi:hypothetical protein